MRNDNIFQKYIISFIKNKLIFSLIVDARALMSVPLLTLDMPFV